jgi:hypothetical protein
MKEELTRTFTVTRVIQPYNDENDLVAISVTDLHGRFEQQSFFKRKGTRWDFECERNERMAIKLLVHNLLMK